MSLAQSRMAAGALAALVFLAIAPTLHWLEFSNGAEGLNVSTALEIRRTGNWLMPTLGGEPRIAKPPLTGWITAAAIGESTLRQISDPDQNVRHRGFDRLAFQTRWPALLAACITLVATFELGQILLGARGGLIALVVAASTLLWLRFGRYATTDIQLAMWVTIANVGLAMAIVEDRWHRGCIIAGIGLGFAFLSKGPVCVVQTLIPAAILLGWRAWRFGNGSLRGSALGLGLLITLAIAVPWFAVVALRQPTALSTWFVEVTREGATDQEPDRWYSYFSFFLYMLPWMGFFIAGLLLALRQINQRSAIGLIYAAGMLFWPIVIMGCFRDRQIRYLVPLIGPAAVVTASAVLGWWNAAPGNRRAALLAGLQWVIIAAIGIGLPLVGWEVLQRQDSIPWYSQRLALASVAGAIALLAGGLWLRRWRASLPATTLLVMLGAQALFMYGYRDSARGRADTRPLADLIASRYPDAPVYSLHPQHRRSRPDTSIYLNRTIRIIRDPAQIVPIDRPQVLLVFQRKRTPAPQLPHQWHYIDKAARGEDFWHAYALPPSP